MKRKEIVMLSLIIISLITVSLYQTLATDITMNKTNVADVDLSYTFDITDQTGRVVNVSSGATKILDIFVTNNNNGTINYGMAYTPSSAKTDGVTIAQFPSSKDSVSGLINKNETKQITIIIENTTTSNITLSLVPVTGYEHGGDLIVPSNHTLINDIYTIPDFTIRSITVNGVSNTSIPTTGSYNLTSYTCDNGSTLEWNPYSKELTIDRGLISNEKCDLVFNTNTNYPLLNTMEVGDYVAYVGNNGCNNGVAGTTGTSDAEAGNSCKGENANQSADTSGYTYGYCDSSSEKFYTYGWRIAYIENDTVYLVSAGAPECKTITYSAGNATFISEANTAALDYCNSTYAYGGTCNSSSAWAMGNEDFKKITNAISGTSSNLTSAYGSPYCFLSSPGERCGYNNDLIDNGGFYWFAAYESTSSTDGVCWNSGFRKVSTSSSRNSDTSAYGLRPIIRLSSSVFVTGGEGTMNDPYQIGV